VDGWRRRNITTRGPFEPRAESLALIILLSEDY
jgi:hypothetical protein